MSDIKYLWLKLHNAPHPGADPGILERGHGKEAKPQTERRRRERWRGASPEKFEKLDAIFWGSGGLPRKC